ncbi:hypothetical protein [Enterococcus faecium]|uniref:hypothetical protein n=1 Tax=Enterococcus faecium TaxID=1352 RepID=UPI00039B2B82|nr:hypothetical protein [Enterococcus faecium]
MLYFYIRRVWLFYRLDGIDTKGVLQLDYYVAFGVSGAIFHREPCQIHHDVY